MIRRLLILVAVGAIVCFACMMAVHLLGGFKMTIGRHGHNHGEVGPTETRDLPWTGTETLHMDNSAAIVTYIQGPTPKFTVTGPKNRIDALSLVGDTLTGSDIHWSFNDNYPDQIHITITSPNTHAFFLGGEESMTLTNYDQDSLDLHVSGAAHIHGVGKAKHMNLTVSGAGNMDMAQLPVDDATVTISGAGNATIDPKVSANVSISGAGHIGLLTRPPTLHSQISGIGSITTPDGGKISRHGTDNDNDKDDD